VLFLAYQALYRQYRPKSFSDISGQEHITVTLKNALQFNKFGHAYLFSGPRGTGKTTIAKIVAKALNCINSPTDEPCNECESCLSIMQNTNVDVLEIDAASNNGVEEIREIRDKVKYYPANGKYKIYIIDEVHMLSTSAFNALLKTLEEPPKYVVFILATTEPYKIPLTILSRCQRFDFKAITRTDLKKRLELIAKEEKINITNESLTLIAEFAEGGMRDAISLLDQLSAYNNENITENDVFAVSGGVSTAKMIELAERVENLDSPKAMTVIDELLDTGKEIPRIINDLIIFFRDLLVYQNVGSKEGDKAIFTNKAFITLAEKLSNQKLFFYLNILNEAQNASKFSSQKRAFFELAIIKMTDFQENKIADLDKEFASLSEKYEHLLRKVQSLEEKSINQIPGKIPLKERMATRENEEPTIKKINGKQLTTAEIGEVLNAANKDKKELLLKGWPYLSKITDQELEITAKLLSQGELVAASENKMILVYENKIICNRMMKNQTKRLVKKILNRKSELVKDYYVLPKDKWLILLKDFQDKYRQGNKKPQLLDINLEIYLDDEEEINAITNDLSTKDEILTIAQNVFGAELVKLKEE